MSSERANMKRRLGVKQLIDEHPASAHAEKETEKFGLGKMGTFGVEPADMVGKLTQSGCSNPLKSVVPKSGSTSGSPQQYGTDDSSNGGKGESKMIYVIGALVIVFLVMRSQ